MKPVLLELRMLKRDRFHQNQNKRKKNGKIIINKDDTHTQHNR